MTKLISTIHFVGGLGAHLGRDLQPDEVLAVKLAKKFHPAAEVFLHTAQASWDNYRTETPFARRVTHSMNVYGGPAHGAHQSDKLRLHVLLSCQSDNALYLDTDCYCVQKLDHLADIESCAMVRLGPFMITNGLIYAGQDRSFLRHWQARFQDNPASHVDVSCRMPHELALKVPGLTVLDCATYSGATGDQAYQGFWESSPSESAMAAMIADSKVLHLMSKGSSKATYLSDGTAYRLAIQQLQVLLDN
jgi:hypothetical protein